MTKMVMASDVNLFASNKKKKKDKKAAKK